MRRILRSMHLPLALLALCTVSFGLMIPFLGFYWDDWPVILTGRLQGAGGFLAFYQYDRPFSAWTYILTFPVFGSRPAAWHIFTLLLRWGTAVALWWTLIQVWPGRRREVGWTAFLFVIYPVFTQQAISVAYSQHWICYLLYFFSLGAMARSQRSARRAWAWTALSLAAALLHLLTMEYFAGLELLRPVLLWLLLPEGQAPRSARLRRVLRAWLPYALLLGGFVIWRLFFLQFPGEDANPPVLLNTILSTPLQGLLRLAEIVAQDTVHLLLSTWANILSPANIQLQDLFVLFSWGMGALAAGGAAFYFLRQPTPPTEGTANAVDWGRQAMLIGAAALLLGMLPVWVTDRQIIVGAYSNRFGLPAMFGASLLLVGLLVELIKKPAQRILLVGLLVGLAVSMHLRVANEYRWSWVKQTRYYWQMSWRAPTLEPGTAIVSDGEIFMYVGLYSTSAGVNLIYPPTETPTTLPYWFYSLGRDFAYGMPEFLQGAALSRDFRHYQFSGNSKDSIVIFYSPDTHDCLEVLTAEDNTSPDLPAITRQALPNSNLARIQAAPVQSGFPPEELFGAEPEHGWCYFYQKADLARQLKNWEEVVAIGDQAMAAGYHPGESASNTPVEWMPMIEGYARLERWEESRDLSLAVFEKDQRIDARLCSLWDTLETSTPESEARIGAVNAVRERVNCP